MQIQSHGFLVGGGGSGLGAACVRRLVGRGANVVIADVDAEASRQLADELGAQVEWCETDVTAEPSEALRDLPGSFPILFAPRVWAELDDSLRGHSRAFELRYVFDKGELEAVASRHRWRRQDSSIRKGARSS